MELFKVTPKKVLDATVWLSKSESPLTFDLWHHVVSFTVEKPKLKDYIIINDQVLYVSPRMKIMTPIHMFKKRKLLPQMHRKTFETKLQDSRIAVDLFEGRKTIEEVLALST